MRSKLRLFAIGVALLAFEQLSAADTETISAGDYLIISAQVIDCGPEIRTIDAGQVTDAGTIKALADIELEAEGKTTGELTTELVAAWNARTGQQSKTIEIKMIPKAYPEPAARIMMSLYHEQRRGCLTPERGKDYPAPDWDRFFHIADAAPPNVHAWKYDSRKHVG